jgi:hypothetical protein
MYVSRNRLDKGWRSASAVWRIGIGVNTAICSVVSAVLRVEGLGLPEQVFESLQPLFAREVGGRFH